MGLTAKDFFLDQFFYTDIHNEKLALHALTYQVLSFVFDKI